LNAGGHHLTNVIIHAANAMLLFMVLRRMMGLRSEASPPQVGLRPDKGVGASAVAEAMADKSAPPASVLWPSAFVAAMFAIHPLDVESVAWVAQRKNVLSTFFWLLTMWTWVRYVEKTKGQSPKSKVFYGLALVFFALGLMSKPMLVTLPFVLLLLDYWPLGRISDFGFRPALHSLWAKGGISDLKSVLRSAPLNPIKGCGHHGALRPQPPTIQRLIAEKLPFLLLAVASSVVTYLGQKSEGAMMTLEQIPLGVRLAKVPVNYVTYLRNTIWPEGLAIPYPHPSAFPVFLVVLCTLLLAGVTVLVLWAARTKPYAAVGWFWFLGTLVPVIGLVQVGNTPVADRFTYVPQIGLYLAVAWAIRDLTVSWRYRRQALVMVVAMVIAALMVCAWKQTSYWRNSESLWAHTLTCTSDNFIAQNDLGNALLQKGDVDEAIAHFQQALQIKPNYAEVHYNFGFALLKKGRVNEAIAQCQRALQIKPDYAAAHVNFGIALLQKGQVDEAITHFQQALQIKPDNAKARNNLGSALLQKGDVGEAIAQYQQALQIKPDYAEAHINLGNALLQKGGVDEAIIQYQQALQIKPDYAEGRNNLGNALLQKGQMDEAIVQYRKALQIKPDYAAAHVNFGIALLQKGQVDEAIVHFQKTLQLNPDFADAHYNLGKTLCQEGRVGEAITHLQKTLQIKPNSLDVLNNLAWLLATSPDAHIRDGVQAVQYAERACELTHYGVPLFVGTLAAAYAEAGRFDDAISMAKKTCALASAAGEQGLLKRNQDLLALYLKHQPYHEAAGTFVPAAP
ncbi:MAG: tetratricopeptide repeat protein, partial [Verrucomicrobiota bacterium]|jgi:tetratricopeptide (TPR) repeat protein